VANKMKDKFLAGKPALGLSMMIPSIQLVEMAGQLGFDWVLLDCEHGALNLETVEAMIIAAEANGITPIVRPYKNEPELIGQYLDRGAKGIQAPHVNTAEEAQAIVNAVKFPPQGNRSIAVGTRAAGYGFHRSMAEYVKQANQDLLVCVQIEEKQAVTNIEEIAAVPGIDVLFVGPSDLSQSLGHPGEASHPEIKPVIDEAFSRILASGKIAGTAGNLPTTTKRLEQGVLYYYTHLTTLLAYASDEYLKNIESSLKSNEVRK